MTIQILSHPGPGGLCPVVLRHDRLEFVSWVVGIKEYVVVCVWVSDKLESCDSLHG